MLFRHSLITVCLFDLCQSLLFNQLSSDTGLHPRARISGIGGTEGFMFAEGRCTPREQDVIKLALRGVSRWSKWALQTTPLREEDVNNVPVMDRLVFETYFGRYNQDARDRVHKRFVALKHEADVSPGRFRLSRSRLTINCDHHPPGPPGRDRFHFCRDPGALSDENSLSSIGYDEIVLVFPFAVSEA